MVRTHTEEVAIHVQRAADKTQAAVNIYSRNRYRDSFLLLSLPLPHPKTAITNFMSNTVVYPAVNSGTTKIIKY